MVKLSVPTGTWRHMLRQYVNHLHTDWDEHLGMAEFAINDAWQESVCETPFMLNIWPASLELLDLANSLTCACCS